MSKEADMIFVNKAIDLLEMATNQYSIIPHTTIIRIKNIIEELEEILEKNE